MEPATDLPLLAALRLHVPARALRAFAAGDAGALRRWLAAESALRLSEARRGALDARMPTVAYAGGGLGRLEDPATAEAIVGAGGAVASEFARCGTRARCAGRPLRS